MQKVITLNLFVSDTISYFYLHYRYFIVFDWIAKNFLCKKNKKCISVYFCQIYKFKISGVFF